MPGLAIVSADAFLGPGFPGCASVCMQATRTTRHNAATVFVIAHRLSTLKSCDRLIYLKDGKIIDTGTFNDLSAKHADFERLIKLSSLKD